MLSKLVHMPEEEINDILDRARDLPPFMGVKIKTDLTRDEVAAVESWKINMPGVEVKEEIKRTNIYGEIASHLLGYIGEVNTTELPIVNKGSPGKYMVGDDIGKFGLEQKQEDALRGIDGEDIKEVDALGRIKLNKAKGRVLDTIPGRTAVPGKNLILTIDQDLQLAATKAFENNIWDAKIGAVVAIDPRNGEILAMLSRPSFDPTEFSRGIPPQIWNKLLTNENHPLRDKTIQDHYPPGSTFKVVTAIAGLEEGVIDSRTTFHCSGALRVGNRVYHCWKKGGHGNVNVVTAITESCDVFFYHVAMKLRSVDQIAKWAFKLGLGKKTGVQLAREVPGLIPTEEWKRKRFHQPWNGGETVNVAIGQGYVLVTAIQLANMYAAIGNGGTLWRPFMVKQIETYEGQVVKEFQPEALARAQLNPKTVELVKEGLWGVVNSPHGTAYRYRLPGMDFVGKTGSAQVIRLAADKVMDIKCQNLKFRDRYHGLFVGFAPMKDPLIAVAVIAEHGCHGGDTGAPVAQAVVKTYLEKYYPELYGEKAIIARLKAAGLPLNFPKIGSEMPAPITEEEDVVGNSDNPVLPESHPAPPPAPLPATPADHVQPSRDIPDGITGDPDE
jgi:penicillin-binding protein 2